MDFALAAVAIGLSLAAARPGEPAFERPGPVVIIVADDLGVDRVGCYGDAAARTPNIDRLASLGVKYRNCWSSPLCGPSRAMLVTGQYGFRTGFGTNPGAQWALATDLPNLSRLGPTLMAGKWHLGHDPLHPSAMGFEHVGSMGNFGDYFSWLKNEGGTLWWETRYATTVVVTEALESAALVRIVSFNAPHGPWHVPPQDLHTYGDFDPSDHDLATRAMTEAMDTEIGRLLAGLSPETLVIFTSDNGSSAEVVGPGAKGTVFERGIHVPLIIVGEHWPAGTESDALVSLTDVFATVAAHLGLAGAPEDSVVIPRFGSSNREYVYSERFEPNGATSGWNHYQQAIRNARWKLIRRFTQVVVPEEYLYDLSVDPGEHYNLFPPVAGEETEAYARLRAELPVAIF